MFPAQTNTGHIGQSSLKNAHAKALQASGLAKFVVYDLRHTCLTRWATYLDVFTLKKLAGHESLATTMRYIHLNERESDRRVQDARVKMASETELSTPHNFPHSGSIRVS